MAVGYGEHVVSFAPNQRWDGPGRVVWAEDVEHYRGVCVECDATSTICWNRWSVRDWAKRHRCAKES